MLIRLVTLFYILTSILFSQDFEINRIEPPNWWVGMKYDTVQVMVYGRNLKDVDVSFDHSPIKVIKVQKADNPNYIFIDLDLSDSSSISLPNYFPILFSKNNQDTVIEYPILARENSQIKFKGFDKSDVVYLIMVDRFCDGDTANNNINNKLEEFTSKDLDGRKDGDIVGIESKLDYLKDLGVTSLWLTPMLENNMWMSYHGYAATDLYKIDPRFGSNEIYKELVQETHEKGLKIIMDHVSNHIGINHWWMKDLPFEDWINGSVENHLAANHNKMTFLDSHSPQTEVEKLWKGWFEDYMPDLNQANPYLKKYLIQNTIWWIEYLGIDGIREDTYPYCNQYYLSEWAKSILDEYPDFSIVGEIWTGEPPFLAGYQRNNKFGLKLNSNLPCVTDFALADAFRDYLSGKKGLEGIFNVLAQDYIYYDPKNLLTFFDNHDIARGLFIANGDVEKYKIVLTMLLTTRGIPKILYGSEIGIKGDNKHGTIRSPFPGGFAGDSVNAFAECGRNDFQNDIFNFTKELLKIRKDYKSLSMGELIHFYPFNNVYVYFRKTNDELTMIVINSNDDDKELNLDNYKEIIFDFDKVINIKNGESTDFTKSKNIIVKKKSAEIFLLQKD